MAYFTEPEPYFKLVFNDAYTISAIRVVNENMVCVVYSSREDHVEEIPTTSPVIAAWVTAQARLRLYGCLEKLQRKVLYFDTDSIIYLSDTGEQLLPTGNHMGDLNDELDGSYITEFVSGGKLVPLLALYLFSGPKQYAFRTHAGETSIKIRGFTLNSSSSRILNFFNMRNIVLQYIADRTKGVLNVDCQQIMHTDTRQVITRHSSKAYSVVFDKRVLLPNAESIPYGFRE
jgi:hypothetical protein